MTPDFATMNYCTRCACWFREPGTCNCAVKLAPQPVYPYPVYPVYPFPVYPAYPYPSYYPRPYWVQPTTPVIPYTVTFGQVGNSTTSTYTVTVAGATGNGTAHGI